MSRQLARSTVYISLRRRPARDTSTHHSIYTHRSLAMIDLHYVGTPNGTKVAIMLEEIGVPYNRIDYNLLAGEHLVPEFRKLNPNNKLPAIVDHNPADGGGPLTVFESGAVL